MTASCPDVFLATGASGLGALIGPSERHRAHLQEAEEGIHLGYIARSHSKPCADTGLSDNLELCTSLADTLAPEKSFRAA